MPVIIDGTAGLTNNATDLNYTGTLTGGTGVVTLGGSQFVKDASGNLGLGVTPSAWASQVKATEINTTAGLASFSNGTGSQQTWLLNNAYFDSGFAWRYKFTGTAAMRYAQDSGQHQWFTAPSGTAGNAISFTQAMTLDASGNLLVGATSNPNGGRVRIAATWPQTPLDIALTSANVTAAAAQFFFNGSNVGLIVCSAATTSYNTSSDYRLKEAIEPMQGALARNALLNPVKYKWKADGSDGEGFIAHELQTAFPAAVTGEKDAVDSEGKPQYQGIGTGPLDGHFAACVNELSQMIQEQQAIITSLTARIEALEGAAT